ncbi:NAD(P)-binding protein [Aspergillus brunneoviolaceus CBS 621.78]|uniref:NAD(P)-binding protein n=1 Tax=Aspergillus brunneoviolaceus CBS 621.78 TaxID=1450534 RepID=A0ACD1GFA8_9EURO|nr:NAD(P)-binding protein [Aspergillus brunneoviolaceus CBS 621.78]RAH47979.1 NAD(P)-binding protein [Aspergillus brunneoviolaceus CBS 621.78]
MPTLSDFFSTQFLLRIPQPSASFTNKTIIVTGANGGLGRETAKHLIRLGAEKVIFACRSRSRGEQAKREIEAQLNCKTNLVDVRELDLESPASIKRFAEWAARSLPRVDVLINNAGIHANKFKVVYDTERTLAVNNIGTFLLTVQMIPKMKATARAYGVTPVITFVASALYDIAEYPAQHGEDIFTWFREESHVNFMNQYNLSKLLQLYAMIKLAALVDSTSDRSSSIAVNALDPCFCKTGIISESTGLARVLFKIFEAITARTAEEGARLVVQTAAAGRETHGRYMRAGGVQAYAPIAADERRATYVWDALCGRLEAIQPGIMQNLC